MTGAAGVERGYRRLLAVYPQRFRREQEEEMLAVLMAGARPGQRRPGLAEALDLMVSGLRMRTRRAGPGPARRGWADALAVLSLAAPLFVLAASLLEVAVPYHLPPASRAPALFHWAGAPRELGGISLLHLPGLDIALGGQVIIVALVLLGRRRLALVTLAAAAGFWIVTGYGAATGLGMPDPLQALAASAYLLEAVALAASPGSRPARRLLSWRHGIVLLLAAAAVQVLTLLSDASTDFAATGKLLRATAHSSEWWYVRGPAISGYVIAAVVLAAAAAALAAAGQVSRYLLLLAVLVYPIALELAAAGYRDELIGLPTPGHLAVLFLPPLLLAGIMIIAYARLPLRLVRGRPKSA
jgi:hypothetical protein